MGRSNTAQVEGDNGSFPNRQSLLLKKWHKYGCNKAKKGRIIALHHTGTLALLRIALAPQPRHDVTTANHLIL